MHLGQQKIQRGSIYIQVCHIYVLKGFLQKTSYFKDRNFFRILQIELSSQFRKFHGTLF